jgi:hypothetical protein
MFYISKPKKTTNSDRSPAPVHAASPTSLAPKTSKLSIPL